MIAQNLTLDVDEAAAQALPALRPWLGQRIEVSIRSAGPQPATPIDSDPRKAKAILDGKLGQDA